MFSPRALGIAPGTRPSRSPAPRSAGPGLPHTRLGSTSPKDLKHGADDSVTPSPFLYFNSRFPRFNKANQRPPSLRTHCTQAKRDAGSPTVNAPAAERSRLQAEGLLYRIYRAVIIYYNPGIPSAAHPRARLQSHHSAKATSAAPQAR